MKIYDSYYVQVLEQMHKKIKINYGNILEELPEQLMSVMFLNENNKVLEIGGNIGRNSMIIGNIVSNNNFVVMECDKTNSLHLYDNMILNNLNFNIECSALSKQKMIQKEWDTIVSDDILEGYKQIDIISFEKLQQKYNIIFDTLVLDCEGAFYYILMDFPDILNNIKLVIIENDFKKIEDEKFVKDKLVENGFRIVYCQNINSPFNWSYKFNFYEVYKKL